MENKELEDFAKQALAGIEGMVAGLPKMLGGLEQSLMDNFKDNPDEAKKYADAIKEAKAGAANLNIDLKNLNNILRK